MNEVQAVLAVTRWNPTVHQSTCQVSCIIELAVTAVVFTTIVHVISTAVPTTESAFQATEAKVFALSVPPILRLPPVIFLTEIVSIVNLAVLLGVKVRAVLERAVKK